MNIKDIKDFLPSLNCPYCGFVSSDKNHILDCEKKAPLISVIIPSRVGEDILSLETLKTQTYKDIEIIVEYDEKQEGVSVVRNRGRKKAKGEYLFFCDNDLVLSPNCISDLYLALQADKKSSWAFGKFYIDGHLLNENKDINFLEIKHTLSWVANFYCVSTMSLIKANTNPVFNEEMKRFTDWDLWLTLDEKGYKSAFCNKVLFVTQNRKNGITIQNSDDIEKWAKKLLENHNVKMSFADIENAFWVKILKLNLEQKNRDTEDKNKEFENLNRVIQQKNIEIIKKDGEIKTESISLELKRKEIEEKKQFIQEKELEISSLNQVVQQKEYELFLIKSSLYWRIFTYLRKKKEQLRKYIPIIFSTKRFLVKVFYRVVILVKKINFNKIKETFIKDDPNFTIGIASYNHSKYLKQCIESALNQDYKNYDILIIDDNSSDPKSREILKEYETNKKISIIYKDINGGISNSLNDQVINAKGDWVAFMDCDDYLPEDALSKMATCIKSNPKFKLIYSNRIEVDENGKFIQKVWFGNRASNKKVFEELMIGMVSSHLKVIHKDVFRKVGLFDQRFGGTHDYDMYLKVAFYMPESFGYVDEYLYYHRIHPNQNTIIESEKHLKNVQKILEEFSFRKKIYTGEFDNLVSILILSFNRGDRLKKSIDKLFKYTKNINKEIIILDNNSNDKETLSLLKKLQKEKDIKVIFSGENLRCSGGRKEMAKLAKGDYFIFLDNDIEIQEGTIEELVIRLNEDKNIAGACCRLFFPDNKVQFNGGFYNIDGNFVTFDVFDRGKEVNDISTMFKRDCVWIPGGATIFRRQIFSVIEHDTSFINAFEDNDFSYAVINKLNKRLVNCPTSIAVHNHVSFEVKKDAGTQKYVESRYNHDAFIKSWARFYEKWDLIIKDDFIFNIVGLGGKSEEKIKEYLDKSIIKHKKWNE
jgi:glycosyltransferase involved in cell wall biosynthesis